MLGLMAGARIVLTDSGGLQEETTALGVPCLTLRENTERPITVEQGTNTMVGRDIETIRREAAEILTGHGKQGRVPELWDGHAAERIATDLCQVASSISTRLRKGPEVPIPCNPRQVTNALTIDVEDYFQVSAFAPHIPRSEWPTRECRVERNVDRILAMLDQHGTKATFFTLGWIAERYPELVRRIVAEGHELASHGYGHERASEQTATAFFADINLAKLILEDLAGQEVKGYRAPSFSIGLQQSLGLRLS